MEGSLVICAIFSRFTPVVPGTFTFDVLPSMNYDNNVTFPFREANKEDPQFSTAHNEEEQHSATETKDLDNIFAADGMLGKDSAFLRFRYSMSIWTVA